MRVEEDSSLVGGGDCFSHYHSVDRLPTQDLLHGLQMVADQVPVSTDITLDGSEDFISVDTSAGDVTIILPRAVNGLVSEILKLYPEYTIIVLPQNADTILLTTGVTISVGNAAIRFKAIGTDWRPI